MCVKDTFAIEKLPHVVAPPIVVSNFHHSGNDLLTVKLTNPIRGKSVESIDFGINIGTHIFHFWFIDWAIITRTALMILPQV